LLERPKGTPEAQVMEIYKAVPERIKAVYGRLQDEESRKVFNARLRYFLDGDAKSFIDDVIEPNLVNQRLDKVIKELTARKTNGIEIIFYGAGLFGRNLGFILGHYNLRPDFFCDRVTTNLSAIQVISPNELYEKHRGAAVVLSTFRYLDEIRESLIQRGFKENMIYDQFAMTQARIDDDYWHHDFLQPVPDEVYVDGGVLDCGSIFHFNKFSRGKYKSVYGFEPDSESYEQCLSIADDSELERVQLINKGLWSSTTTLKFNASNNGASRIATEGAVEIDVTTVDETVGDNKVTFIKMDIEGAELEALKGAAKTIKRDKPRLAICVYHKLEDILEIPLYINGLVPEYKFYLRHESINMTESILFAIAD
jgi:FkbM family methyltransferase